MLEIPRDSPLVTVIVFEQGASLVLRLRIDVRFTCPPFSFIQLDLSSPIGAILVEGEAYTLELAVQNWDHAIAGRFVGTFVVGGIAVLPGVSVQPTVVALGLLLVVALIGRPRQLPRSIPSWSS